jgi:hypothetical protein
MKFIKLLRGRAQAIKVWEPLDYTMVHFPAGARIFLSTFLSRPALGSTRHMQFILGAPLSVQVNNKWSFNLWYLLLNLSEKHFHVSQDS